MAGLGEAGWEKRWAAGWRLSCRAAKGLSGEMKEGGRLKMVKMGASCSKVAAKGAERRAEGEGRAGDGETGREQQQRVPQSSSPTSKLVVFSFVI